MSILSPTRCHFHECRTLSRALVHSVPSPNNLMIECPDERIFMIALGGRLACIIMEK